MLCLSKSCLYKKFAHVAAGESLTNVSAVPAIHFPHGSQGLFDRLNENLLLLIYICPAPPRTKWLCRSAFGTSLIAARSLSIKAVINFLDSPAMVPPFPPLDSTAYFKYAILHCPTLFKKSFSSPSGSSFPAESICQTQRIR